MHTVHTRSEWLRGLMVLDFLITWVYLMRITDRILCVTWIHLNGQIEKKKMSRRIWKK